MLKAFKELRVIHRKFESAEIALKRELHGPTCIGCGNCCAHNTPMMMTIEALCALSMLTGEGKLSEALGRAEDWLLTRHKEAPSYEGMYAGRFLPNNIRNEWQALTMSQCPFLTDEKTCFIYGGRPLTCRAFGITRIVTDICSRPLGKDESYGRRKFIYSDHFKNEVGKYKESCRSANPSWVVAGLVPTLIYRAEKEKEFRDLVADNKIASAKLVGVDIETSLMWQPDLDRILSGENPELVIA